MKKNSSKQTSKIEFPFPDGLLELRKLERKYPNWGRTPKEAKQMMAALALNFGGIESLLEGDNEPSKYLLYLSDLSFELYDLYVNGTQSEIEIANDELAWLTGLLQNHYTKNTRSVRDTKRKLATIYVEIEKHLFDNPGSKIMPASRQVAKKLDIPDPKYVQTRYYRFKKQYGDMSLEEIVKSFHLNVII